MMDAVVVARTQRCSHAPCRTSVALRPKPNPEGNAEGSARDQVTFSLHHQ